MKFNRFLFSLLTLGALTLSAGAQTQVSTNVSGGTTTVTAPQNFFDSVQAYFTSFNTNSTTFESERGELWTGVDQGNDALASVLGATYDVTTNVIAEAAGKLMGAGVEYYHVDYVRLRKTCHSAEGQTELEQKRTKQTEAFSFSDSGKSLLPLLASVENSSFGQAVTVPIAFDGLPPVAPELDAAVLRGACARPPATVAVRKDRNGGQHVEWFPGAKP